MGKKNTTGNKEKRKEITEDFIFTSKKESKKNNP